MCCKLEHLHKLDNYSLLLSPYACSVRTTSVRNYTPCWHVILVCVFTQAPGRSVTAGKDVMTRVNSTYVYILSVYYTRSSRGSKSGWFSLWGSHRTRQREFAGES